MDAKKFMTIFLAANLYLDSIISMSSHNEAAMASEAPPFVVILTVVLLAAGYHQMAMNQAAAAAMYFCHLKPVGIRLDFRLDGKGALFTHILRSGDDSRMFKSTRLHQSQFEILLQECKSAGLTDGREIFADEKLAMFMFIIGGDNSYRDVDVQFSHSTSSIKACFHEVLGIIVKRLYRQYVVMPELKTPARIRGDRAMYPWFEHCVGALDGSHIPIAAPHGDSGQDHVPFRNRKAGMSQNVLAAVDFDHNFVYVLAGWEGSANDQKVINDAMSRPRGSLRLETPWYFLADAGYSFNCGLTLPPFKNVRYHLQEWNQAVNANQLPRNKKELFNKRHSSLRNVVERVFGVMKSRFKILRSARVNFSVKTQVDIVYACVALHNFINATGGNAVEEAAIFDDIEDNAVDEDTDIEEDEAETQPKDRRDDIARRMFQNWQE